MNTHNQILTSHQMREAERALEIAGVPAAELMQQAGFGAAEWVWRIAAGRSVTVLCGPGNNGGDGYVIARRLADRRLTVNVVAPDVPITDAAREARKKWPGPVTSDCAANGGVLVDCLFGTGLSRALSPDHLALLNELARRHERLVAVDLPSGVAADDGAMFSEGPVCDLTLALGAWKPAHWRMPASARMGERRLVDLGIGRVSGAATLATPPRLLPPPPLAHKYSRGLLGVVTGAMPGAALLAASAAMRAGAGYVKLLDERRAENHPPELVCDAAPLEQALADPRWSALLVGPGLGRDERARNRLSTTLDRRVPTVIDADALHLLDDDLIEGLDTARLIVTPHEGELAALCKTFGIGDTDRIARAAALATTTGLTVLAKGPDTALCTPGGRVTMFPPATSWLSTAGTGDVLAGILASRIAVHGDLAEAAREAVFIHAEAARRAGPAFTAGALAAEVSGAYAHFL